MELRSEDGAHVASFNGGEGLTSELQRGRRGGRGVGEGGCGRGTEGKGRGVAS